jgi:hypothetical protein
MRQMETAARCRGLCRLGRLVSGLALVAQVLLGHHRFGQQRQPDADEGRVGLCHMHDGLDDGAPGMAVHLHPLAVESSCASPTTLPTSVLAMVLHAFKDSGHPLTSLDHG